MLEPVRCLVAGDLERRRGGGAWTFPKGVLTVGLLRAVLCRAAERARGAMRQPPRLRRPSRYLAEFWALLPVSRAGTASFGFIFMKEISD